MRSKRIQIKLSEELLAQVDQAAAAYFTSRSSFIKEAVAMRLRHEHIEPDPMPETVIELVRQSGSV